MAVESLRAKGLHPYPLPAWQAAGVELPWRVKQRRADQHLRQLAEACDAYMRDASVELRSEVDAAAGTILVRLHAESEPPSALGATIGDVLHNLRSALDAVAWAACQVGPLTAEQEANVYFPITRQAKHWGSAKGMLPNLTADRFDVFRRLQPWVWDEEARSHGVDMPSTVERHPLVRLHEMAKTDRHRLHHPVLARVGQTWLGTPADVEVEVKLYRPGSVSPGDAVVEWRIDPPAAVETVDPGGDVLLALSEDGALARRSALAELQSMQNAVVHATRTIEVQVLGVVSPAEMAELDELDRAFRAAEAELRALIEGHHVIDSAYMSRHEAAARAEASARSAWVTRWRELFD